MKKLFVALFALSLAGPVLAQGAPGAGPGPGAGPRRGPAMRKFDPATVVTVAGQIVAVHELDGRRGTGLHVDLKTADATYDVHLGPASFLAKQSVELKKGDEIEVTGSKVEVRGRPSLIAQTVKKGQASATLRDAQGVPAWSRRGTR